MVDAADTGAFLSAASAATPDMTSSANGDLTALLGDGQGKMAAVRCGGEGVADLIGGKTSRRGW